MGSGLQGVQDPCKSLSLACAKPCKMLAWSARKCDISPAGSASVTANLFRVVFDLGGMDPLADLILRNESASVFNLPQIKFASRSVPSPQI